jgi:hypothetical protein
MYVEIWQPSFGLLRPSEISSARLRMKMNSSVVLQEVSIRSIKVTLAAISLKDGFGSAELKGKRETHAEG